VREAVGYCDESPGWWAMWTDLVTRADVHEIAGWRVIARNFAYAGGLDPRTTIFAFAPPWRMWFVTKYGHENVSDYRYPRPPLCATGTIDGFSTNSRWGGRRSV